MNINNTFFIKILFCFMLFTLSACSNFSIEKENQTKYNKTKQNNKKEEFFKYDVRKAKKERKNINQNTIKYKEKIKGDIKYEN